VVSFQCSHVRSVDYCSSTAESEHLKEDVLSEMVAKKWFGGDRKAECLKLQSLATSQSVPLSVETTVGVPTFKHYVSVFEPKFSYYSHLRRVMVVYNARTNSWHCPCIQSRRSCTLLSGTYFKSTPNSSEANRAQNLALKWTRLLQIMMMTCLMVVHTTPPMEQC